MEIKQYIFSENAGWDQPIDPNLNSESTLVLCFFPPNMNLSRALADVSQAMANSVILGCSGAGEIANSELLTESLVVTICRFKKGRIRKTSYIRNKEMDSLLAGKTIAESLNQSDLKAIYLLSEGLKVNGTELVKGIKTGLSREDVLIAGGLAGDGFDFKTTYVLNGDQITDHGIVAIGLYGSSIQVASQAQGGWTAFGPERVITKSAANVLIELDGRPALSLYKEFLGPLVQQLPSSGLLFPLQILDDNGLKRDAVRTLLAIDEKSGTMTFAGDMPTSAKVRLMKSTHSDLVAASKSVAAGSLAQETFSQGLLALVVSCVGRRLVLGQKTEDELEVVYEQLKPGSVMSGFYSYGEISSSSSGFCDLHNQTMTLCLIGESDD